MRIVIIGGTGLIGSRVVTMVRERGHEATPASPRSGVNAFSGEGLATVLTGADVVVDASNSPSSESDPATFFESSTRNILAAETAAGVRHHVLLSIVGVERQIANGYHRGKLAQETLSRSSAIPYSIVRATQFFEFLKGIADSATAGGSVRLAPVLFQPAAAADVARIVCDVALGAPAMGIIEVAGPQPYRLDELVRRFLRARKDPRTVVTDAEAPYFGTVPSERSMLPNADARFGTVTYEAWQQQQAESRGGAEQEVGAR